MCDFDKSPSRNATERSDEDYEWITTVAYSEGVPTMTPEELAAFLAEPIEDDFIQNREAEVQNSGARGVPVGSAAMLGYAYSGIE